MPVSDEPEEPDIEPEDGAARSEDGAVAARPVRKRKPNSLRIVRPTVVEAIDK
jgi:hypothetical protein